MASKQVQDLLVRLKIDGLEGLDSLKGAFRELAKTIGPTEQTIEKARQSIIEFGEAGNKSEQLIKGQIEAFKGLRSQATQGGKVYKELTADIKKLEGAAYGASPAVEAQRKALTALGLSADATASQIEQAINSLINLRGEVRVDSQAFDNFGKSIAQLTDRFRAVNQEAQNFADAQRRIVRPIGATSAAARQQIRDLDLVTESLREQRDALGELEGEARIRAGAAGLAERGAPAVGRRTFQEAVAESLFGGDIKKLLPAKDIKAALDEVVAQIANFQQEIETKLSRKIQISFQETARAARESARAMAAAFSDPELINVFNQFDKRLGELPDTTTGLNQRLSELSERLVNTKRNTVDYLVVAMQMAGVQRELTAVTQGYAQALLMGIRTGTVAPSARNLQEVITALRAEMSQLDVTTSEGARAYAENAREARALEQRLNGLANAYRHVGDMAAQAATAETSAATARITANYLTRGIVRQQEEAMAELGQRVRAGVAGTPLALPAAGQTSAPGTGLEISGGARVGRATGRIQRFFSGFEVGEAEVRLPGQPIGYGPQAIEEQSDRARRAAISEADAVRTAGEARAKAEQQVQSYRAEIDKARKADIGSIESTQRLRGAIDRYRSTLPGASAEFKKLTKELGELDARSEKLGRGLARRRMTGMQMTQAAGAAISGGIFGGPEGFLGGVIGSAFGVGGAFAGAAIGAQISGIRQQAGAIGEYVAQLNLAKTTLAQAASNQDEYNRLLQLARSVSSDYAVALRPSIEGLAQIATAAQANNLTFKETEAIYRGVIASGVAFGKSQQDLDALIRATTQVLSKGKVSAEEMSGQIGERLPGAVAKFAAATGRTLPELTKAFERGEVTIADFVKFASDQFEEYDDVAQLIAEGPEKAGVRLQIALDTAAENFGGFFQRTGSGLQDFLTNMIDWVNQNSAQIKAYVTDWVNAGAAIFNVLSQLGGAFARTAKRAYEFYQSSPQGALGSFLRSRVSGMFGGEQKPLTTEQLFPEFKPPKFGGGGAVDLTGGGEEGSTKAKSEADKAAREAQRAFDERLQKMLQEEDHTLKKFALEEKIRLERERQNAIQSGTLESEAQLSAIAQQRLDLDIKATALASENIKLDKLRKQGLAEGLDVEKIAKQMQENIIKDLEIQYENQRLNSQEIEAQIDLEKERESLNRALNQELQDRRYELGLITKEEYNRLQIERERRRLEEQYRGLPGAQGRVEEGVDLFRREIDPTFAEGLQSQLAIVRRELDELTKPINQVVGAATAIGDAFSQSFASVINGSATTQEALASFFQNLANYFLDMAAQIIQKMIVMAILNQVVGLLPGAKGTGSFAGKGYFDPITGLGAAGPNFGLAMGGVVSKNGIQPFAMGGIVNKPTLFKYADGGSGRFGLMGEAGPEAIIPLKRGRDGKLGIAGGGGVNVGTINISVENTGENLTPAAQKQIAGQVRGIVLATLANEKRSGGMLR